MKSKKVACIFNRVNKTIELIAAVTGVTIMASLLLLLMVEVLGRYFLGKSTLISIEFSGYMLVAITYIGLTWTQKEDKHIRVSVVTSKFSTKIRKYLSLAVSIVSIIFIAWLVWATLMPVVKLHAMGVVSLTLFATPLWIPYMFVPIGLGMLAIQLLGQIISGKDAS